MALEVGIVGDFDLGKASHWATEVALLHTAARLKVEVVPTWVATASLSAASTASALARFDGIWAAPGSPYVSGDGMLRAIEFARVNGVPFLGTCGGFQYSLIEFTRNVLGLRDADSAENGVASENVVITAICCAVPAAPGTPRHTGADPVLVTRGSLLHELCGGELNGEYFCSFEANPAFEERWERGGLVIAGRGLAREVRAATLLKHPFFLGTLFQPQLSSSFRRSHPIIDGFVRAASRTRTATQS